MELTICPECGAPAQVEQRHVLESTDGPLEHAKIRCVTGHWFFLSVTALAEAAVRRQARPARPVSPLRPQARSSATELPPSTTST